MTFTVTYRDQRGAKREEAIEAESRAACVAACRARGISPLAIREGAKGLKGKAIPHSHNSIFSHFHNSTILAALGILALLAILGGIWWYGRGTARPAAGSPETARPAAGSPGTARPTKGMPREVAPAKSQRAPKPAAANAPAQEAAPSKREVWLGREIVRKTVVTNGTDLIITRIDAEGKVHKEYTTIHKRLFSNPVDIALSILLTTPEGALMPPLPPLGPRAGDAFIKALKTPIEVPEDATPEERRVVDIVLAAREEMLEELGNGRTVNEVIEDHCTFADENNRFRAEAMAQYKKLVAEGDEDMAEQFRAKANEMLAQKGAKPLKSLAEIQKERLERREKREAQ